MHSFLRSNLKYSETLDIYYFRSLKPGNFLLWVLVFLLFTSCYKSPSEPKRLRISFHTRPLTVDPRQSGDFVSSTLLSMVFEGLTKCMPDGTIQMALAERVEISKDQLTYTFYLRPSFWSDGKPLKASDFERSWKQILNPSFPSPCPYLFYPIKNAQEARKGLVSENEIGIHALSDSILEIVLERPTPYFLSLTAFPSFLPTPPDAEEQFQNPDSTRLLSFVSNGPFLLEPSSSRSEILLKKNKCFWNQACIRLEEIDISIVANEITALQMFTRGELDWLGGALSPIPADFVKTLPDIQFSPMAATTFCAFQLQHPLLKNKNLRLALSLAINRIEIVEKATQLGEIPATRFIPPSLYSLQKEVFEKSFYQAYDPNSARAYLQKAFQELGQTDQILRGLTLSFRSSELDKRIAQILQAQWKETLGLDIALIMCEPQCLREKLYSRNFDIALSFWIAQFSDPVSILERFEDEKNLKNYPGWSNPTYQKLLQEASLQMDRSQRFQLMEKAEQLLAEEMPLAPIYHWSNPSISNPNLKNIQTTPNGGILFEYSYIEKN